MLPEFSVPPRRRRRSAKRILEPAATRMARGKKPGRLRTRQWAAGGWSFSGIVPFWPPWPQITAATADHLSGSLRYQLANQFQWHGCGQDSTLALLFHLQAFNTLLNVRIGAFAGYGNLR